jgi:hypothetical protein
MVESHKTITGAVAGPSPSRNDNNVGKISAIITLYQSVMWIGSEHSGEYLSFGPCLCENFVSCSMVEIRKLIAFDLNDQQKKQTSSC